MIMAYGGGEMLRLLFSATAEDRGPALLRARAYFLSALACLAASLVNPYTYHLHVHMAQYLRDPWNSQHIMEFLSPSFHHPAAIFFELMLVMAVITSVSNVTNGQFTYAPPMLVRSPRAVLAAPTITRFTTAAA